MKRKILLLILILLMSSSSIMAFIQDAELSLYNQITNVIEEKEPEWRLDRKAIMTNQLIIRWSSEKGRALVSVILLDSEAKAKEVLKSRVNEWEHMPESRVSKRELKNFGDEGYVLKNEGSGGAHVFFRKGSYEVEAFGPSEESAKRFAKHIADLLPPSNNSLNRSAD